MRRTQDRITRMPRAFDEARAGEVRAVLPDLSGDLARLCAGAGGTAPYLHGLLHKEATWITGALEDPEAALAAEIEATAGFGASGLRQAKRRIALLAGLCDLGGIWDLAEVTKALTLLADHATDAALKAEVAKEVAKGKLPDVGTCGGLVALAMGKQGAYELNYSSDIDLICLYDDSLYEAEDQFEVRAALIRAVKRAMAVLSEQTAEGYVFRTDLRLRPDPSVTPVCVSMSAAENYYASVGRTWERAAYIKARACAGDVEAGQRFLNELSPFVWRKNLDFYAIQDTHDMRLKIRDHKGLGGAFEVEGHNIKLGRGGIREIEFFAQTEQLIAGGRNPDLRVRGTVEALGRLAQAGWVSEEVSTQLSSDYVAHRELEHRLQMLRDAQTHALPTSQEDFERLAALMDTDVAALKADVAERSMRVNTLTEDFFAPQETGPAPTLTEAQHEITERWPNYACMRTERAQDLFDRVFPDVMAALADDEALEQFDRFLSGLPAGVQLFALFEANPKLIELIVDVIVTAPHLSNYLARNRSVIDAVVDGSFFEPWPEQTALTAQLCEALERAGDYEDKLDAARRWYKDWHFRIGVHQLRGLITAKTSGQQYCQLARACVQALYPVVVAELSKKHGAPPGKGAMVLGMGSLGAGLMTAASDLDMIVIYDADGVEASEGPRPLASRMYYSRLTQALITALTTQTAEGRLYEVDMRLRPSGKQGPVATSLQSFMSYQREEAWVWEHLALTRGCGVAGDAVVRGAVEAFRKDFLKAPKERAHILKETQSMRVRLKEAKPGSTWDPKNGAGRMMDIELLSEAMALIGGVPAQDVDTQLSHVGEDVEMLKDTYALMWRLQSAARLLTGDALDFGRIGRAGRAYVLRANEVESEEELATRIEAHTQASGALITRILEEGLSS